MRRDAQKDPATEPNALRARLLISQVFLLLFIYIFFGLCVCVFACFYFSFCFSCLLVLDGTGLCLRCCNCINVIGLFNHKWFSNIPGHSVKQLD